MEARKTAGASSFDGPNSLHLEVTGLFRDGNLGWQGWTDYNATDELSLEFECNSQTGHLKQVPGVINSGGGSDPPLKVIAAKGDATFDEAASDVHYVQVGFAGDVGVEGSYVVTVGGGYGVSVGFEGNYSWSKNLGPWEVLGELVCRKGASN